MPPGRTGGPLKRLHCHGPPGGPKIATKRAAIACSGGPAYRPLRGHANCDVHALGARETQRKTEFRGQRGRVDCYKLKTASVHATARAAEVASQRGGRCLCGHIGGPPLQIHSGPLSRRPESCRGLLRRFGSSGSFASRSVVSASMCLGEAAGGVPWAAFAPCEPWRLQTHIGKKQICPRSAALDDVSGHSSNFAPPPAPVRDPFGRIAIDGAPWHMTPPA